MASKMIYLVMDCYPITGSDAFREFVGSTVGCWVRSDSYGAQSNAETFAKQRVSAVGWSVAKTLVSEEVSSDTYTDKIEGREFFEQAEIDGFVANFHVRARESIGDAGNIGDERSSSLIQTVDKMARGGGVSLLCGPDGQWANGVTPDGDEFLPFWLTEEDAAGWLEFWPDYKVRHVAAEELRDTDLLERIDAAGMWVAVGIGKSVLITCHCAWVRERVSGTVAIGSGSPSLVHDPVA